MNASLEVFEDVHLPWNLDAEKATLGALLVRPEAWRDVADAVAAEDFYRDGHQRLFRRMASLVEAGRAIDAVTLLDGLDQAALDALGGLGYLTQLTNGLPRSTNAVHYAEIVREHARRRACIALGQRLIADAQHGEDVEAARAACEQGLRELETGRSLDTYSSEQAVSAAFATLDAMADAPDGITGVRTGFPTLDRWTGGLQRKQLHLLAARPSVGKTALMGSFATQAAVVDRVPTVIVTLEQPHDVLLLRMASAMARVDLVDVRTHRASDHSLDDLARALAQLNDAPLTIIDHPQLRVSDVRRRLRRLHAEGRCGYVLLDYLGLLTPDRGRSHRENREQQVGAMAEESRAIARELEIPFVLLTQMNREWEKTNSTRGKKTEPKRPNLTDLRESGQLEQHGDTVIFIHRPYARPRNFEESTKQGATELILAKQRNGPIGNVTAHYTPAWVRFEEVE